MRRSALAALALALLAVALAGCGRTGRAQLETCERIARILFQPAGIVELESSEDEGAEHGILTRLTLRERGGALAAHHVRCAFAGGAGSGRQLELRAVASDTDGRLDAVHMAILALVLEQERSRAFALHAPRAGGAPNAAAQATPRAAMLYFLQQLVNGATLAAIVALLAVGYTLIYAIVGVINLSFGAIYMIGAVVAALAVWLFVLAGAGAGFLSLALALPPAMAVAAGYSAASERLVFRPLRDSSALMPLIASIGLAIVLENYVFLAEGARTLWLPVRAQDGMVLAEADGFSLFVNRQQLALLLMTALLAGVTWYLLARTSFGRCQRACAQDRRMAALLGVDIDRVTAATFALGGGLAAASGLAVASYYGGASFAMGLPMGLKALTAAIVGGIGNYKGALLGGVVVAYLETFWAGYLPGAYRELAVFALLILVLVFRPQGLLGEE